MIENQTVTTASNDTQQFLLKQVNLFLFELRNLAQEHGFKANHHWILQLVTEAEKTNLDKYKPLIAVNLEPDLLISLFYRIKNTFKQALNAEERAIIASTISRDSITHLIAFPAKKIR